MEKQQGEHSISMLKSFCQMIKGDFVLEREEMHTDASPGFASWLIKPSLDIVLPVLLKVSIWDDIVVLHHGCSLNNNNNNNCQNPNCIRKAQFKHTQGILHFI